MGIYNFNNTSDYFPIITAAMITDIIVIILLKKGAIKSKTLEKWYSTYGFSAGLADVLSIVIGIIVARFLYFKIFTTENLLYFIGLTVLVQLVHDVLFYFLFSSIPRGVSKIMDSFKDYANENGSTILIADSIMMISTILLATYFTSFNANINNILFIVALYLIVYFIYSV
jgi:hypothetical protein